MPNEVLTVDNVRLTQLAAAPRMRAAGRVLEKPPTEEEMAVIALELLSLRVIADTVRQRVTGE